jgi:capsular polysaccharide biosynthesis protein
MIEVDPEKMVGTGSESGAVSLAQQLVITYKDFATDPLVLSSVIEEIPQLAGLTTSQLKEMITLSSVTSSVIVRIEVVSDSPELAALIANTLVLNSIELSEDHRFLEGRVTQMLPAEAPSRPTSPNKILNVVISFLVGGILSLGIVFVKELFNNKFQSPAEMEKYLNINVIAAVPGTIKERKLVD